MITKVELEGVNQGDWFTLAGDGEGDRGVYLAREEINGLYDPPVRVVWEEPANLPGARYLTHRILRRDLVFAVEILNDEHEGPGKSWRARDSDWRKAWAYDKTSKLYVTTDDGTRFLKVQMNESPSVSMRTDPNGEVINRCVMTVAAGDPFWYEEDATFEWRPGVSTTGGGTQTQWIAVTDPNPTDQYIWPVWVISAPGKWTLPDYSWEDNGSANRRIIMPTLLTGEDCVVNTDPRVKQVISDNNSNVLARMKGVRFKHPIPPYTLGTHLFQVDVTGAPADAVVQLRLPRPWSRPWGLM